MELRNWNVSEPPAAKHKDIFDDNDDDDDDDCMLVNGKSE